MKKFYILAVFSISIVLAGCAPNIEDAKKLGFESLEQMAAFQARGYKSMNDYQKVKELTPDYFYKNCYEASKEVYNRNCKGKKISWTGIIQYKTSSSVRIVVLGDNMKPLQKDLTIDSKSLKEKIKESDFMKIIEFDGTIDAKNFIYPDIENTYIVKIESDSEKDVRTERVAKEKAAKAAEITKVRTYGGLTEPQWVQRCEKYAEAIFSCATAANVSKCTEIRMGGYSEFGMAQIYCDGSTPNWYLMGGK